MNILPVFFWGLLHSQRGDHIFVPLQFQCQRNNPNGNERWRPIRNHDIYKVRTTCIFGCVGGARRITYRWETSPDSKIHGANMGSTWGRQDPDGSHVGPMNLAIWVTERRHGWSYDCCWCDFTKSDICDYSIHQELLLTFLTYEMQRGSVVTRLFPQIQHVFIIDIS